MPTLVTITGPIASGKNTVAELLAKRCQSKGLTVVIADVDDVAAMVTGLGAAASGLWFAAHEAHGALVAQWMLSEVNVVISVGPIYTPAEQEALFGSLPAETRPCRVLIDAPLSATWERAHADERRGLSRQYDFHVAAHARFRSLMPGIPSDLVFNSGETSPDDIADAILRAVDVAD
jgi:adenylylsulfate kinase-like enzyme